MEARKVTPWKHAESSVNKWGGKPEDYIEIHDWFDETKQYTGDWTHRVLRHHAAGIQWAIEKFFFKRFSNKVFKQFIEKQQFWKKFFI